MPAAAALLLAAAVAAGSLDPPRRTQARHRDELSAGCTASELHGILRDADIFALGTVGGRKVVLASPHGGCICGNVNCPFFVLRLDPGGASAVLLGTSGYGVEPVGRAQPLRPARDRTR